jgi:hypothetical protein
MRSVLVSLPSGAGVVRTEYGLLVTADVGDDAGGYVRDDDPFRLEAAWVSEAQCVVGGRLPPGASCAEVVDDRGQRVVATVGAGAYVAVLEHPYEGREPVVCCRDGAGRPVRRPRAADYPSRRVVDAEEPCPACGATDWDVYTPFEQWRAGRGSKAAGTHIASPVISCRVCGHEETEANFFTRRSDPNEDENARAARIARVRKDLWRADQLAVRAARFPIYAAENYPTQLGGSGSVNDELTEITVHQYLTDRPGNNADERPCLAITTDSHVRAGQSELLDARQTLKNWAGADAQAARGPDASHAAMTLWSRARDRERHAASLNALRSEQLLIIDGVPVTALMLRAPNDRWVARARHADLTITIAARDIAPSSLRLTPIAEPAAQLLEPEPPDA